MGENEKALEFYNKSLEIQIRVRGQDHPDTAATKNKCAFLLFAQTPLFPVLSHCFCVCSMAIIYAQLGKHADALTMWENVLQVQVKTLGLEHPVVADTKYKYAAISSFLKGSF